ncbi:MAG: hypothetical protein KC646_00860 [Candidatus Cloacimonetes bacterium]|nr:hypothetical protein [Candidatus Cloacimonadota bacterium]
MTIQKKLFLSSVLAIGALSLVGCSLTSNSEDYSSTAVAASTGQITGTVSTGAPSRFARVSIRSMKDSSNLGSAIADKLGKYNANVALDKAPYLIKSVDNKGKENFSFVKNVGTANVNQLSSLALMLASKTKPADIFNASGSSRFTGALKTSIESNLNEAKSAIRRVMDKFYKNANVAGTVDPITTPITTFNSGFDQVLDSVSINFSANSTTANIQSAVDNTVSLASLSGTAALTNIGTALDNSSMISSAKIDAVTGIVNKIAPIKAMLTSFVSAISSSSVTAGSLSTYFAEVSGKTFSGTTKANLIAKALSLKTKVNNLSEGIALVSTTTVNALPAFQVKFFTELKDGGVAANLVLNDNDMNLVQKVADGTWKFVPNNQKASLSSYFKYTKNETAKSFELVFKAENKSTDGQISALSVAVPGLATALTGSSQTASTPNEKFKAMVSSTDGTHYNALLASSSQTLVSTVSLTFADNTSSTRWVTIPKRVASSAQPADTYFPSVTISGHSTSYIKNGALSFAYAVPTSFTPAFLEAELLKGDSIVGATSVTMADLSLTASSAQMRFTTLTDFTTKYILRLTAWNSEENEAFSTLWEFDPNAKELTPELISGQTYYEVAQAGLRNVKAKWMFNADGTATYTLEDFDIVRTFNWTLAGGKVTLVNGSSTIEVYYGTNTGDRGTPTSPIVVMAINGVNKVWYRSETDRTALVSDFITLSSAVAITDATFSNKVVTRSTTPTNTLESSYTYKSDKTLASNVNTSLTGTWSVSNNKFITQKSHSGHLLIDTHVLLSLDSASGRYETFLFSNNSLYMQIRYFNFAEMPTTTPSTGGSSGELPAAVKGKVIDFVYESIQTSTVYATNDEIRCTFSSSGLMFVKKLPNGTDTNIGNFTKVGNEYLWTDSSSNLSYMLSMKTDGTINEINVFTTPHTTSGNFLGQFKEKK